jgi:hypothetical protein
MKSCPKCGRTFEDEYNFCLEDGTVLTIIDDDEVLTVLRRADRDVQAALQRSGAKPTTTQKPPDVPQMDSGSRKMCAICGVSFPVEEFHYGNRLTNSYCKACCKAHGEAYARGGRAATQRFRDEMRKKWKS